MLSKNQGKAAVQYAREILTAYTKKNNSVTRQLPESFQEKHGVFVTLHTFPHQQLRGCIGIPESIMPLEHALKDAAESVTHDPRFPPLKAVELSNIIVEVTILSQPKRIEVETPQDYLKKITIGTHGLIAEQGYYKGLLLPQVPVEQSWDVETFLCQTCMKAGLPADAWYDSLTILSSFTGQIFSEIKPRGDIMEKKIDASRTCH